MGGGGRGRATYASATFPVPPLCWSDANAASFIEPGNFFAFFAAKEEMRRSNVYLRITIWTDALLVLYPGDGHFQILATRVLSQMAFTMQQKINIVYQHVVTHKFIIVV